MLIAAVELPSSIALFCHGIAFSGAAHPVTWLPQNKFPTSKLPERGLLPRVTSANLQLAQGNLIRKLLISQCHRLIPGVCVPFLAAHIKLFCAS